MDPLHQEVHNQRQFALCLSNQNARCSNLPYQHICREFRAINMKQWQMLSSVTFWLSSRAKWKLIVNSGLAKSLTQLKIVDEWQDSKHEIDGDD